MSIDPSAIEAVAKLMCEYELDEYASPEFTLRKSRHRSASPAAAVEQMALAKHLEPLPDEPWMSVPAEAVDAWAEGRPKPEADS